MNKTIADSITIRVGHGIMTIPRDPHKSSSAENSKQNKNDKKTVNNEYVSGEKILGQRDGPLKKRFNNTVPG
jgi:hypothetical protein